MTRDEAKESTTKSTDQIPAEYPSEAFIERSGFNTLTPEQRLDWLNLLAIFNCEFRGKAAQ